MVFPPTSIYRDNRGMALLITIMVISLLIAVTVQFNRTVRQSFFASAAQLEGQHLSTIARSGFTIGAAILEADGDANTQDSLQDLWAGVDSDAFTGLFNRGELKLVISDFSGRLQVNSLVQQGESGQNANENREILKRLLLSGNVVIEDEQEAQEIVDALTDWLDADDRESDFGAETSYYQSLDPPYSSQNGPVGGIEELLLVKGITPELLFGGEGRPGLADFLTVYGTDGKLNINTAPEELLQALHPLMTEELAVTLDEYRREEENIEELQNPDWYRNVPAWPGDIELPGEVLSTRSYFFQLRSEGIFHDQSRRVTAVVQRDSNNKTAFLYRRVE